jgi:hypothetical protein
VLAWADSQTGASRPKPGETTSSTAFAPALKRRGF